MIPSAVFAGVVQPGIRPGTSLVGSLAGTLHQFTLQDTSGSGSTGFFRKGLAFAKGEVASGDILEPSVGGSTIRSAMMQKNTWSDGSLRSCILVGDAGSFTAGETKTAQVSATTGTQSTSGFDPYAFITGLTDDLTVEIRNHTGTTNSTNVGNLDFSLKTAILTTTRRETQEDTPVCVRVFAWQAVSPDVHLNCLHYVDIWLDSGGSPIAYEWTPVLSQHWWIEDALGTGAQTKQERNYDATIKQGSTTLVAHAGLNHAYYCQWAGLRTDNDDQHARRFWFDHSSAAMPTLNPVFTSDSWKRMMKAGYIPPLDLNTVYTGDLYNNPTNPSGNGGMASTYEVLGRQGHKEAVNAPGGYVGRGALTDPEGKAITGQTPFLWRQARVMAQAGMSTHQHIRDHRLAVGGAFDGDASMGLFPQKVAHLGAQSYPGLAAETIAVTGTGAEINDVAPNDATNADANGLTTTGAFRNWDEAHHTVYAFLTAFVEGERYLADSVLDQLGYVNSQGNFNSANHDPTITFTPFSPPRDIALGLDGTTTYGFSHVPLGLQERSYGWTQASWDLAYALLDDSDRHRPFLLNIMQAASDVLEASYQSFPASHQEMGTFWIRNPPIMSSFMNSMTGIMFARTKILTEDSYIGHRRVFNAIARYFRDTFVGSYPYAVDFLDHMIYFDDETAIQPVGRVDRYVGNTASVDNGPGGGTVFRSSTSLELFPAINDVVRFSTATDDPLPPEINASTDYYLVELVTASGAVLDYRISATPSGSPITTSDIATNVRAHIRYSTLNKTAIGDDGTSVPPDDDFMTIASACVEYAYGAGSADISAADMVRVRQFMAGKPGYSNFSSWNLTGDQLL